MGNTKGFSLIEVMITIAVIAVVGGLSLAIFTQTLSTSRQSGSLSDLKQNGERAANIIAEVVRNAEAIICYGPADGMTKNIVVVRTAAGKYTRFRFAPPSPPTGTPTQNGYIARLDNLTTAQLSGPNALSEFCSLGNNGETIITNNNSQSGVSISDGQFIRISGNLSKDTISVSFNVNPSLTSGGTMGSNSQHIETTVQVR